MKVNLVLLCFLFFVMNATAQVVPAGKAYKFTIQQMQSSLKGPKAKVVKNKKLLQWDQVKQGEDLLFSITVTATKKSMHNLYLVMSDLVTQGHMGSISASFFRFSDNEKISWEPSVAVDLVKGETKVLYCRIKIPQYISPTIYRGTLSLAADGISSLNIPVVIDVSMNYVRDSGI